MVTKKQLIYNALIYNEGRNFRGAILVENDIIADIFEGDVDVAAFDAECIDAELKMLMPGVIDDQVHFREPGLTYKGDIYSESRSAVAGGITSFMEMPNTIPNTLTQDLLEEKYAIASEKSLANYSFYMGASNDNSKEVLKTDPKNVCGIKVFMGSSTGNMLVDNELTLERIFSEAPCLVAVHCEHEPTIQKNVNEFLRQYGLDAPANIHPLIRNAEACYRSSAQAVELAAKYNTRLHVLHLSSAKEMSLFRNDIPLSEKKITAEVCLHHLWFTDKDYESSGNFIKWNPAVKSAEDRDMLWNALIDGRLDVVATDHAPHSFEEKSMPYFKSPSGGPMVQHLLPGMLDFYKKGKISLEMMVGKMCHNPAIAFNVEKRGFIREGYFADLVLVDLNKAFTVNKGNILYKCGWSPMENIAFPASVTHTFVNGNLVYENGRLHEGINGMRLKFDRN